MPFTIIMIIKEYAMKKLPPESSVIESWIASALAYAKILAFFEYDKQKALIWFETPNPLLGGISPQSVINQGRGEKLLKLIINTLDENNLEIN